MSAPRGERRTTAKEELEKLFRHAVVFLVGLIFQHAARLLLLPFYWSAFPPAQFGLLDLFKVFIQVMVLIFSFALPSAYIKFHRVDVGEGIAPEHLRGTTAVLSVGGLVLLGLAMAVLQTPLSWLFFSSATRGFTRLQAARLQPTSFS